MQTFDLEAADRTGRWLGGLRPASQSMIPTRRHLLTGALATASVLAAPAIVKAQTARRSIDSFADGTIQRGKGLGADWTACFNEAANSGVPVEVPSGFYPFRRFTTTVEGTPVCVSVNAPTSIDFACAPDATFIIGSDFNGKTGTLFRFENPNGPEAATGVTFRFTGGYFDGSGVTSRKSRGEGIGILDVYQYANPYFANISGYGGRSTPYYSEFPDTQLGVGNIDTLLTTHNCYKERIHDLRGEGFFDCCLYLSGDSLGDKIDGRGEQALVTGLVAVRCVNGIACKRDYVAAQIEDCSISLCQNGIICGRADDGSNFGRRTRVIRGYIGQIQGRPIIIYGIQPIVENVTIGEYGLSPLDRQVVTGTTRYNQIAAIDLRGCTNGRVSGCTIKTRAISNDPRFGIALRSSEGNNPLPTTGCTISGNDIVGPATKIYMQQGSENNTIGSNP